jgi:hypothetical protein
LKSNMDVDNSTSQEKEIDPRWNALLNTKKD